MSRHIALSKILSLVLLGSTGCAVNLSTVRSSTEMSGIATISVSQVWPSATTWPPRVGLELAIYNETNNTLVFDRSAIDCLAPQGALPNPGVTQEFVNLPPHGMMNVHTGCNDLRGVKPGEQLQVSFDRAFFVNGRPVPVAAPPVAFLRQ